MSRADKLWAALRKTTERAATPVDMMRDLFGSTSRGNPDTAAAARELGVSRRTVQRWLREGLPRKASDAAQRLVAQHASWRSSSAGRRAALSSRREARLRNKGTTFVFYGDLQISDDLRKRGVTVPVTGEAMGGILDASLAGDDALALRRLENAFGDAFGGSVHLQDIDQLDTNG